MCRWAMTRGVIRCALKEQGINRTSRPIYFHMLILLAVLLGLSTLEVMGNNRGQHDIPEDMNCQVFLFI
jgi:hypothetical protein